MYEEQRLTIPATGKHDWSDWWIVKKSTVFKTGTKKRECWICDKTQTVSIPKLKPFVKLNKKTISLTAGKSYRLKASYAKGDSVKKCKSSNKKVATVSKKGVISARQAGKVRITIYTKSGKKATCKVTVTAKKKVPGAWGSVWPTVPASRRLCATAMCSNMRCFTFSMP